MRKGDLLGRIPGAVAKICVIVGEKSTGIVSEFTLALDVQEENESASIQACQVETGHSFSVVACNWLFIEQSERNRVHVRSLSR